jgi:hypothetical protein
MDFPYRIRRLFSRYISRPLAQLSGVIHPIPPLSAVLFFLLLTWFGQLREIYLSYVEGPFDDGKLQHAVFALLSLALLSGALYYANYVFSTARINFLYSTSPILPMDRHMRRLRRFAGLLTASAPWLGLVYGLLAAAAQADRHRTELRGALGALMDRIQALEPGLSSIDALPWRLYAAAALVALLGAAVAFMLDRFRHQERFRDFGRVVGISVLIGVLLVPGILSDVGSPLSDATGLPTISIVPFFRAIGPLAMIALVATSLVALLSVLSLLSAQVGFPLIRFCLVLAVIAVLLRWQANVILWLAIGAFGLVGIWGLFSRHRGLSVLYALLLTIVAGTMAVDRLKGNSGEIKFGPQPATSAHAALAESFRSWLEARKTEREAYRQRGRRYPVFIISAQGGGIYAAAAAATFLARMQDYCDSFASHVFAISAVSGGAVGAAVFESMLPAVNPTELGCRTTQGAPRGGLGERSSQVILDDHLSPLLGLLPADLLGLQQDRAVALESSFMRSVDHYGGAGQLRVSFDKQWTPAKAVPALLLNATWVETGYRVAFAPFALGGMRDGTLYAFGDRNLAANGLEHVSLAGAAIVSARFPGVVPAFSFRKVTEREGKGKVQVQRWNFVDGGYADESGSATALEVYKALEAVGEKDIDLRLILLTQARPETDFSKFDGTAARDLLAPANTLLSVRDLLSWQSVMRTLGETDAKNVKALAKRTSPAQQGDVDEWTTTVVELDHQSFTLALGWNISRTTHAIVSLMMGWPELCSQIPSAPDSEPEAFVAKAEKLAPKISAQNIRANSCVMQALTKLVEPRP